MTLLSGIVGADLNTIRFFSLSCVSVPIQINHDVNSSTNNGSKYHLGVAKAFVLSLRVV